MDLTPITLRVNRHDRGWPRFQLKTFITVTDHSYRYCIEPMGYRDTVWYRSGYVELVVWRKVGDTLVRPPIDLDPTPMQVGPDDILEGKA